MRFDVTATPLYQYADEVMRRLDHDWDGRIALNDPFLTFRQQQFLRLADRNLDNQVDRWELEDAIGWRIDRNLDRQIDGDERRDARTQYDLPDFGRDRGPLGGLPTGVVPATAVQF